VGATPYLQAMSLLSLRPRAGGATDGQLDATAMGLPTTGVAVVYDGLCPLCSAYTRALRIRREFGALALIDARERPDLVAAFHAIGRDLDKGFACAVGGRVYCGPDAVNVLALVSTGSRVVNRLNAAIFRSPAASRLLYPAMRAVRNALLWFRGVDRLDAAGR